MLKVYGEDDNWDGKSYDELQKTLSEWRKSSPEKAVKLSLYLIEKYPEKEEPYGIAFTLYSLERNFTDAEKTLLAAIRNIKPNQDYYIKLAHFYRRVYPEKLTSLIENFEQNEKQREDYNQLLAKFHIINRENEKAVTFLKEAVSKGDRSVSTIRLLSNLLSQTGKKDELWKLLKTFILNPENKAEQKIEFFQSLLSSSTDYSREDIVTIVNLILTMAQGVEDYPVSKKLISDTISVLISSGKAKDLGDVLEKEFPYRENDSALWIHLGYLQQTGEYASYHEILKNYKGKYPFILEDQARLLEQDGDTTSAARILKTLADLKPGNKRIQLTFAQFYNRNERREESQAILDKISMKDLDENLVHLYGALCFENLTELRRFRVLVERWIEAGDIFENQHLNAFAEGILGSLPDTYDHLALMTIVDERLTTGTKNESPLLLFKIHLAEQVREFDLYFELADRFLSIQDKFDSDLIYPYVQHAMKRGMQWVPEEENEPPKIEITNKKYVDFAEKWLSILIRKNSIIPQYHVDMIYIRKAQNREKEILEQVESLAKEMRNDPERVHLTAYVLATSGFAEKALPYYEKAIALKPDMVRYKMNYAGCLIRTEQYQKAIDVYMDVVTGGYTTKTWNLHEVLRQILYCQENLGKEDEFFRLLEGLKKREDIPKEDIYMNAGAILKDKKKYDAAIKIVQEFISRYPDNEMNYNAHMMLADVYADKSQFDRAIEVYQKCQKRYPGDKIKMVDCLFNIGEMERRKGNAREAIRLWKELAQKHPDDAEAQNALAMAGEVAETDLKDLKLARELYRQFLNINPKDGLKVLMVKYKMEMLKNQKQP
ncbi:tetratricopeptide repeat protein [Candidatus Sumerlaeota bacterium]|nr:tetratricopeptide repeat protein [Candidatus Sumerlaeota bacterium]